MKESKWHLSQLLTPQKAGAVIAEFNLRNYEEIKRWILSFGKHAVVMGPTELRIEIEEELTNMLEGVLGVGVGATNADRVTIRSSCYRKRMQAIRAWKPRRDSHPPASGEAKTTKMERLATLI